MPRWIPFQLGDKPSMSTSHFDNNKTEAHYEAFFHDEAFSRCTAVLDSPSEGTKPSRNRLTAAGLGFANNNCMEMVGAKRPESRRRADKDERSNYFRRPNAKRLLGTNVVVTVAKARGERRSFRASNKLISCRLPPRRK